MDKTFDIKKINNFNSNTMVSHIGIEILEASKNYVSGRMPVDERTIQPYGLLHGGASVAFAESLGSFAGSLHIDWKKEAVVGYDDKFSAMQKSTAFSISSVAALMAEGIFDDRKIQNRGGDIKLPLVLTYRDVPFKDFEKNLTVLGIKI